MFKLKNKKFEIFNSSIFRTILFILITISVSLLFYYNAKLSFNSYYSYRAADLLKCKSSNIPVDGIKATDEEVQKTLLGLENNIKNSDLKLLKNFIIFNIYIENNFKARNIVDNQNAVIKFNIDKKGNYVEVKTGQKKKLLKNLQLADFKKIEPNNFTYKIDVENISQKDNSKESLNLAFENNESIKFYIELSFYSFWLFVIISIPVTWGIFLLINAIRKYIISGKI